MSRFVLVSFAFLGWGFYELSGGANFTPPERPISPASQNTGAIKAVVARHDITVTAASLVTRTNLEQRQKDLVRARAKNAESIPSQNRGVGEASGPTPVPAIEQPRIQRDSASLFSAGLTSGEFQLASLEAGLGGGLAADSSDRPTTGTTPVRANEAADTPPEPSSDLRSIRASRVNMRQGPGTAYPIVTRLLAGDEVVVIADSGTGWLHLRTPDNAHFGWIAASLVSKKTP